MDPCRQSTGRGRPSESVTLASTSTPGPTLSTTGALMNTAWNAPARPSTYEVRLEGVHLTAESVAPYVYVDGAEGALVGAAVDDPGGEQDHARRRSRRPASPPGDGR